jgi:hypothetical protein
MMITSTHTRIFIFSFFWVGSLGLLLQVVILPNWPSLHAGNGLLKGGDWVWFHAEAINLAKSITANGWSAWTLRHIGNSTISLVAAAYYFTNIYSPLIILPINALLFAFSAVCIYEICSSFNERAALFAILPFLLFPSGLMIYGQMHKDVFAVAGMGGLLLMAVAFARKKSYNWKAIALLWLLPAFSCLLIWLSRPYLLKIALLLMFIGLLPACLLTFRGRQRSWWIGLIGSLILISTLTHYFGNDGPAHFERDGPTILNSESRRDVNRCNGIDSPEAVRDDKASESNNHLWAMRYITRIADIRKGFTQYGGSTIDRDACFGSVGALLAYLPRALQIALFSPFPSQWFATAETPGGQLMRTISAAEMVITYICLLGLIVGLIPRYWRHPALWVSILIALTFTTIQALVFANIGTLYRMRFINWHLLTALGMIGWYLIVYSKLQRRSHPVVIDKSS